MGGHRGDRAAWVIRHGLRTLTKQGQPEALRLLGYDHDIPVAVTDLTVTPTTVPISGEVTVAFTLTADTTARAVVDYAIHHAGARGTRAPKLFKLTTVTLEPGRARAVRCRHAFREVTVRRLYPGPHIQVNGHVLASTEVTLTKACDEKRILVEDVEYRGGCSDRGLAPAKGRRTKGRP